MLNQKDHGDINWWTISEGWHETKVNAHSKYVFANKSNGLIPYGSYVINGDTLRVETNELLNKLDEHYNVVRKAILKEIADESDLLQIGDYVRYADPNGSYGKLTHRRDYDDGFYVQWCYGLDNYGNYMYSTDSVARNMLIPVDKKEYDDYINRKRNK